MSQPVLMGASLTCSFGSMPSTLSVLPSGISAEKKPIATIMDNVPFVNIMPFGPCISLSNPAVASATAAALGVLTPMPCTPVVTAPWAPGATTVMVGKKPALTNTSKCFCAYGGVIQVTVPGATTETLP
jgi:hypothetical protein